MSILNKAIRFSDLFRFKRRDVTKMLLSENHLYVRTTRPLVVSTGLTNLTTAGALTYSAAQIATGLITRDPAGASRTDVTATALDLIAGGVFEVGDTFTCMLINTADAAEVITLEGGVGVTISNVGQTVAQNEAALLVFRMVSTTAVTLYIIGA